MPEQVNVDSSSRPNSSQSNNEEEEENPTPPEAVDQKPSTPKVNGEAKVMSNESVLVPALNQNQDNEDSELEDEEVDEVR